MAETEKASYLSERITSRIEDVKFNSAFQRRRVVRQADDNLNRIISYVTVPDSLVVYPSIVKDQNNPKSLLADRLQDIKEERSPGLAYLADCLAVSANIQTAIVKPKEVLFDVCLFRQDQATFVLSVVQRCTDGKTDIEQYNLSLTKGVIRSVRTYTSDSFSAVYGIMDMSDMHTKGTFISRLNSIKEETSRACVRDSLTMSCRKYKNIIRAFLTSIAVTEFVDTPEKEVSSNAFWFLTLQQFCILSENIDSHEIYVMTSSYSGGKVLLLEVAQRLQKYGPVLIVSDNFELVSCARKHGILTFNPASEEVSDQKFTNVIISCSDDTTPNAITCKAERIWRFQKIEDVSILQPGQTDDGKSNMVSDTTGNVDNEFEKSEHDLKSDTLQQELDDLSLSDISSIQSFEMGMTPKEVISKRLKIKDILQQKVAKLQERLHTERKVSEKIKQEHEELKQEHLSEIKLLLCIKNDDLSSTEVKGSENDSGKTIAEALRIGGTHASQKDCTRDNLLQSDSSTWEVREGNMTLIYYNRNHMLNEACRKENLDIVKHLVSSGTVNIDTKSEGGLTPVMIAALKGNEEMFHLLVVSGCNLSDRLDNGNSILHVACLGGSLSIVAYLLGHDVVQIESRGRGGRTAVMIAAKAWKNSIFHFLVRKGVDLSLVDNDGNNIMHIASSSGNVEIVDFLISNNLSNIECMGQYGRTSVMFAALHSQKNVFKLLVQKGCDLSVVDRTGNSILHVACLGDHVDIPKYLIYQKIVEINSRGRYGRTPVMFAAEKGKQNTFDFLKSQGSDLSMVDDKGNNILHVACFSNNSEIVDYLVSNWGADIESRGQHGRTPLMFAAERGQKEIFDLLVTRGSNVSVLDHDGNNILHVACISNKVRMVEYILTNEAVGLESKGRYGRTAVMKAARSGYARLFSLLVDAASDLTVLDDEGNNILHLACTGGNIEIVKRLVFENSVDINHRNRYGRTPRKVAEKLGKKNIEKLLKRMGGRRK